ncbi:RNA polymerase sigma factor RpoE [soil metagenome]
MRPSKSEKVRAARPVSSELIDRCRAGDERAWNELVETTYRDVYGLCLRILVDPEDARDTTQEAYLKVWRSLSGFRGEAQFGTWLYRVAANAAISKHRSRKRQRAHVLGFDEDAMSRIPAPGSVEEAVEASVGAGELEAALRLLPDHHRAAVVLRDVYGMSIPEIAGALKVSETAAKVRVHRARKRLRELVFPAEPGTNGRGEI